MKLFTAILITGASYFFLLQLVGPARGLPLSHKRGSRQTPNFPNSVPVVKEEDRPKNSCKVAIVREEFINQPDGNIEPVRQRTFKCCEGYGGVECDRITDPYLAASPCSPASCPNFPDATCAVVSRCGKDEAIFLSDTGDILDCGTPNVTTFNITSLSCTGVCPNDPCAGITCTEHPNAMCLTVGCSCEPVWILDSGVSVNCTTGQAVDPQEIKRRRRREISEETPSITLPSCES
uniref:Uncharacterized protein n=1 Tax=Amphimedon queenslandica TaxID=400682 RepID=A0A1X7UK13_AMPQE